MNGYVASFFLGVGIVKYNSVRFSNVEKSTSPRASGERSFDPNRSAIMLALKWLPFASIGFLIVFMIIVVILMKLMIR